jgi:hypothetical protein
MDSTGRPTNKQTSEAKRNQTELRRKVDRYNILTEYHGEIWINYRPRHVVVDFATAGHVDDDGGGDDDDDAGVNINAVECGTTPSSIGIHCHVQSVFS